MLDNCFRFCHYMNMATVTIRVRLRPTPQQQDALTRTLEQYTESFNRVCAVGWTKKRINGVELHHETYADERAATDLNAQLVCSARVKATEALASARALKKKGKKVSMPQSKHSSIRYDARSSKVWFDRNLASLSTVDGRLKVAFVVPDIYRTRLDWKQASIDLVRDGKGRLWLHVVMQKHIEPVEPTGEVVGVDLGVVRPAVTSEAQFLGERRWREIEERAFRLKRALQAKNTRSARRHLRKLGRRVNRFRKDCDHVLSRRIVNSVEQGTTIALEDLTDIRTRMKGRKKQRRRLHGWSFHRLQAFLAYKAELAGVNVAYVDARYTSQKCNKCGHTERGNRQSQSEFRCRKCGHRLNADLNAARNIRDNYLASVAMGGAGGPSVNWPIVTHDDLKTSLRGPASECSYKPPASAGGR